MRSGSLTTHQLSPSGSATTGDGLRPTGFEPLTRWLIARFRRFIGRVPLRIELWNGVSCSLSDATPCATIAVRNLGALLRMVLSPARWFGEAYAAGDIEVHGSLAEGLERIFESWPQSPPKPLRRGRAGSHVLRRARRRAQHHYDLGNDFYRLWLDERMVYTCAYFETPELGLEEAQLAKMDYVCRKLRLRPGERVLEAGCGWGALARHMAARYGAHVTACNVSREQVRYARERATQEGLSQRAQYVEDDFRNVPGRFDVFVSVGMLEHVGRANYAELGRVIHDRLDPAHGRGLLHFIGRNRPLALNSWVKRRIFPGAYPPTPAEVLSSVLEPWDLSVLDVENLRLHYASTLQHWRERFERNVEQVAAMFDPTFVRSWRLYLAGSEAAFAAGWLQLFQVVFARGRENQLPWTRAELYRENAHAVR
jgi:cyclopropane-fatty-acyl-phospholipid synthase